MTSSPEWRDDLPDWQDGGKRIAILRPDGTTVEARIMVTDVGFAGEDEYPIWSAEMDDGSSCGWDFDWQWRMA